MSELTQTEAMRLMKWLRPNGMTHINGHTIAAIEAAIMGDTNE